MRDLLDDPSRPADAFPPEEELSGFDNDATVLTLSERLVERQFAAAAEIALRATAAPEQRLGCQPAASGDDPCVRGFIESFGARAFRRPLAGGEAERFYALYDKTRALGSPVHGVRAVIEAVLLAPQFLYRLERTTPDVAAPEGMVSLDAYSLASRLSYFIWGSLPDTELFQAAQEGRLRTAADVAAQARRMLEDARAREVIRRFHRFWFGLTQAVEKDTSVFPEYTPELAASMREETERFVEEVVLGLDGGWSTLVAAPFSFVDDKLAAFYGIAGVGGPDFRRVELDGRRRAGFLTQASMMSRYAQRHRSEPITRGLFVRKNVFCQTPPDPPEGAQTSVMVPPGLGTREHLAAHAADPACRACHELFDPIGLSLENLDGIGRWRDSEDGRPIDASGTLVGTDVDGPFVGPVELSGKLASSAQAQSCLMGRWFLYGHGRPPTDEDRCTLADLEASFRATGSIRELIVALTQTDAFLRRKGGE